MTEAIALSVKQPWAALIVAGKKTIEVRRWPTSRLGSIYIHAARISDPDPWAWRWVSEQLRPLTELVGGFIGRVELVGCLEYRSAASFEADQNLHLNDPASFVPPVLYGFRLRSPQVLPFVPYSGKVRFFKVKGVTLG